MKKIVLVFLLGVAIGACAQNADYVSQVTCRLASQEMYGRGYDHHGDSIAAEFIRQEMIKLKLKPLGDNYLQHYNLDICYLKGNPTLKLKGKSLRPYYDYRLQPLWRLKKETLEKSKWNILTEDFLFLGTDKLGEAVPLVPSGDERLQCYVEILNPQCKAKAKFLDYDIKVVRERNYRTQNVVGYLPGESDTMMVFTAHYDHLGSWGDSLCFYGAHDNASGTALVLDLARLYSTTYPHRYTLVFMLFSGEEAGLCGSSYAARNPIIDYSKVKLLVNLDMFCGGSEGIAIVNATDSLCQPFVKRLIAVNDSITHLPEIKQRTNAANSDHYPFTSLCPAIFIYSLGGPYGGYHSPSDDCQSCGIAQNYPNMIRLITSLIE
jgi:hypothetical protein